jgi:natural product precursor
MKNVKSTKTLMSFSDSSMNPSEMKKVQGGWNGCKNDSRPYGCPNL